jgi:hypothetical protein
MEELLICRNSWTKGVVIAGSTRLDPEVMDPGSSPG